MNYNFIYTEEYQRPLRAVLVDVGYTNPYPTVEDNDLFYVIEETGGSLAGVLILTVNNTQRSCEIKFQEIRRAFHNNVKGINAAITNFISSNNWQQDFLFT